MFLTAIAAAVQPTRLLPAALLLLTLLAGTAPAPGEPQVPEAVFPDDPRLAARVTLKLKKSPLSRVTAELSQATGATLRTAADMADEPAVVWVTDQPAREVMRQVAALFGCRWARSGKRGEYRYELYQDLNARRQEETLRQQDRRRAVEALQANLRKRLEMFRERPNPSNELDVRIALGLTPAHWAALAGGQTLYFSTRRQPGAFPLPSALAGEILRVQQPSQGGGAADPPTAEAVLVRLWLSTTSSEASLQLDRTILSGSSAGTQGGLVGNAFSRPPGVAEPPSPEQEAAWRQDPVLGSRRPFRVDPRTAASGRRPPPGGRLFLHLHEILPEIAETYGLDVVADAYRAQYYGRQPPTDPAEMALWEVLLRHVAGVSDWTRDGTFFRVRSRAWYHDRLAEIPEHVIRHWSARLRGQPRLPLEDAVVLVQTLHDEQLPHFGSMLEDEGIYLQGSRGTWFLAEDHREILRAYGSLPARQQQHLRSGGELADADMPPAAHRWLFAALEKVQRSQATPQLLPGEAPQGHLTLAVTTVEREVTSADENQVKTVLRALDGPRAGKEIGGFTQGGSIPPGFGEGAQVFQQVKAVYGHGERQQIEFDLDLPWVYVDPTRKEPAPQEKPAPGEPGARG